MDTKLIAAFACAAALALGACSGNNASGTTGGGGSGAGSGNNGGPDGGNGNGGDGSNGGNGGGDSNGGAAPTALQTAETEYDKAQRAATNAVNEARLAVAAGTEAARTRAETLIAAASMALAEAVRAADAAVAAAADGSSVQVGAAARVRRQVRRLQTEWQQDRDNALDSLAWYGRNLVRYELASGEAVEPREGVNTATVVRILRTIPNVDNLPAPTGIPQNVYTQIPNPKRFDADTFKTVMYEDGKRVFSVVDDGEGGDEFKVDGYVNSLVFSGSGEPTYASGSTTDNRIHTGLKLTDDGLVIRTGGTANIGTDDYDADSSTTADYTDMRRDISRYTSDTSGDGLVIVYDTDGDNHPRDGIRGQNGWDLEITFDEPQTRSVPVDFDDISNPVSSWTGNNAFYWKAIAPADPSQLDEDGDYYSANAFNQPKGYRDLGTYEVWLSNQVGLDRKREPAPGRTTTCPDGSRGTSCPSDDEHRYLKYAAYGLFAYTASTETFKSSRNGQVGRINTLHFGYSAFGTENGQKTEDIGQAITGGKFHGYALAYEFSGVNSVATKLLRGDVTLTVNIPKGPLDVGVRRENVVTVQGTINNFQQWNKENKYWTAYADNVTVALNRATIGENGAFIGNTQATPSTDFNPDSGGVGGVPGAGYYKGSFYGPRADAKDLEVAGSWTVGTRAGTFGIRPSRKTILGSFGAKQRPPETPASD